jgi:hypothetical protein
VIRAGFIAGCFLLLAGCAGGPWQAGINLAGVVCVHVKSGATTASMIAKTASGTTVTASECSGSGLGSILGLLGAL